MELSDAILKGCAITPYQAFGTIRDVERIFTRPLLEPLTEVDLLYKIEDQFALTVSEVISTCVMGAVFEGMNGRIEMEPRSSIDQQKVFTELEKQFPQLLDNVSTRIPFKDGPRAIVEDLGCCHHCYTAYAKPYNGSLKGLMINLNDEYKWTREQIAAWVKYVVEGAPMIPED